MQSMDILISNRRRIYCYPTDYNAELHVYLIFLRRVACLPNLSPIFMNDAIFVYLLSLIFMNNVKNQPCRDSHKQGTREALMNPERNLCAMVLCYGHFVVHTICCSYDGPGSQLHCEFVNIQRVVNL
jgi:hypothetical protein